MLAPDFSKLKVVGLTHELALPYAPMTITVSYAGQDGTPKPFLMIINWIRAEKDWKVLHFRPWYHRQWQKYRAIRKSYALVYRDDEVQPIRNTAFPELSTPQALLLDIERTTFSNAFFRWSQATSA